VGVLFAIVLGGIGWIAGGASQQGADRTKSAHDAHELATDLTKAKDTIDQMKAKVTDGGKSLVGDRKFPRTWRRRSRGCTSISRATSSSGGASPAFPPTRRRVSSTSSTASRR